MLPNTAALALGALADGSARGLTARTLGPPAAVGLVAVLLGFVLVPVAMRLARHRGWMAKPRPDRWHTQPTALMGGIGIFSAATLALAVFGAFRESTVAVPWVGGAIMFVLGAVDDRRSVSPGAKLLTEMLCAVLAGTVGIYAFPGLPAAVAFSITVLWVVGITNAINLLDNMDGLATGIAAAISVALGVVLLSYGDSAGAMIAFATAGAAIAFLRYNFYPAQVFMGDCGSLFLGYTLALLALRVHMGTFVSGRLSAVSVLLPLVLLAVPIADTTLVTVSRLRTGRRIWHGGRDHASHRLVYLGYSERSAALVLTGCAVVGGLVAVMAGRVSDAVWASAALAALAVVTALFVRLGRVDAYATRVNAPRPRPAEPPVTTPRVPVRELQRAVGD